MNAFKKEKPEYQGSIGPPAITNRGFVDTRPWVSYTGCMPIFEYRCKSCGTVSEYLTGVSSENQNLECVHCGGSELSKQFTIAAFSSSSPSTRAEAPPCGAAPGETCGHCQHAG
ncbi:MAG: zinc ribbon domain-containing protein [Spirochaetales bacterium]|nr:zinc ribbon domain-containing protein [Spirochaetales bacterium]